MYHHWVFVLLFLSALAQDQNYNSADGLNLLETDFIENFEDVVAEESIEEAFLEDANAADLEEVDGTRSLGGHKKHKSHYHHSSPTNFLYIKPIVREQPKVQYPVQLPVQIPVQLPVQLPVQKSYPSKLPMPQHPMPHPNKWQFPNKGKWQYPNNWRFPGQNKWSGPTQAPVPLPLPLPNWNYPQNPHYPISDWIPI